MMNGQAIRFKIGIFVLASLVLFGVLITLFSGFPNIFKRQVRYTIRFTDAPGVGPGTPVRKSGVRIGDVKDITLDEIAGRVLVEVGINEPYRIRKNDQPTLSRNVLGGDAAIDLVPKPPGVQPPDYTEVPPDSTLDGVLPTSVSELMTQAPKVVDITQKTLEDISKSLKTIDRIAPQLEEAVKEVGELAKVTRKLVPELGETNQEIKKLAQSANQVMPDLGKTNDEIRELVKATRETIPVLKQTSEDIAATARHWGRLGERMDLLLRDNQEKLVAALDKVNDTLSRVIATFSDENQRNLAATLKNVRDGSENLANITKSTDEIFKDTRLTIKRVNEVVTEAGKTLENLNQATKPLAERSASIVKNLDESVAKFNGLLTDVQTLLRGLGDGNGTIRRLLNDPSLYNNLDAAACAIARMMPRVDRVLRDMEVFADKLARHPETIGAGGLIRPSSGLKGSPLAPLPR